MADIVPAPSYPLRGCPWLVLNRELNGFCQCFLAGYVSAVDSSASFSPQGMSLLHGDLPPLQQFTHTHTFPLPGSCLRAQSTITSHSGDILQQDLADTACMHSRSSRHAPQTDIFSSEKTTAAGKFQHPSSNKHSLSLYKCVVHIRHKDSHCHQRNGMDKYPPGRYHETLAG